MNVGPGEGLSVVILVVLLAGTPPAAGSTVPVPTVDPSVDRSIDPAVDERGITGLNYSGPGIATRQSNRTYVWKNGSTRLQATIQPFENIESHEICLGARASSGNRSNGSRTVQSYGCKDETLGTVGTRVTFELDPLGIVESGQYTLVLTVRGGDHVDTATVPIYVLERDADLDGDGLTNAEEVDRGTNLTVTDTDSDGLADNVEVTQYHTDPTRPDTDGDGLRDGIEVQGETDPTVADTDGDGLLDGPEVNEYDTDPTEADSDGDGLPDGAEVNEYDTDPTEADSDGDGYTDQEELEQFGSDPRDADDPASTAPWDRLPELATWGGVGVLVVVLLLSSAWVLGYWRWPGPVTARGESDGAETAEGGSAEILSPEERVLQLLEDNGGKIRQREIVEGTDWSKAKVSRILSGMEESGGAIERTRIGRENVVSLADGPAGSGESDGPAGSGESDGPAGSGESDGPAGSEEGPER